MPEFAAGLDSYRRSLGSLCFGKRVGLFVYFHIDATGNLPPPIRSVVTFATQLATEQSFEFNIVKAGTKQITLSLLNYPGFWRQAFPILERSAQVVLDSQELQITDYRNRKNKPVLHRKELLLPQQHSHFAKFAALTSQAEELGLFKTPQLIGLSDGWRRAVETAGVKIVGHKLVPKRPSLNDETPTVVKIHRHRSALRRQQLSQPFQILQKYGYLESQGTVFDYGCGRGDDVRLLQKVGVRAEGWDPFFQSDTTKRAADIVNLGFVINVIESRPERDAAVREAFELANNFLIISTLIGNPEHQGRTTNFTDGVVTSIGTFQRYYLPDEFENYIRGLLNVPVLPVGHGIVIAFKSQEQADRFNARRAGNRSVARGSLQRASELFLLDGDARELLNQFWERSVMLGREPLASELPESISMEELGLSTSAAFRYLSERSGSSEIQNSAFLRKTELLVQFALGHFDGRVYFKYLSEDVRQDIKVFFGGFNVLREQSKQLLFAIADTDQLLQASHQAADDGLGYLLTDKSLQLHVSVIDQLPPLLQVYIGCAVRLVGGVGRASLVKVHTETGKVSFLAYDDFDGQPVPMLIERIKVNLWTRRIDYFDYIAGFAPPPLLMKSLFLPEEYENFDRQAEFDRQVMKAGLFDSNNPHPSNADFSSCLRKRGISLCGFQLVSDKPVP
jgi:DNA phosphorothioation-associated putative methyltransferase